MATPGLCQDEVIVSLSRHGAVGLKKPHFEMFDGSYFRKLPNEPIYQNKSDPQDNVPNICITSTQDKYQLIASSTQLIVPVTVGRWRESTARWGRPDLLLTVANVPSNSERWRCRIYVWLSLQGLWEKNNDFCAIVTVSLVFIKMMGDSGRPGLFDSITSALQRRCVMHRTS